MHGQDAPAEAAAAVLAAEVARLAAEVAALRRDLHSALRRPGPGGLLPWHAAAPAGPPAAGRDSG